MAGRAFPIDKPPRHSHLMADYSENISSIRRQRVPGVFAGDQPGSSNRPALIIGLRGGRFRVRG